jgi:diaminopimelate epimerase
MNFNFYKYQGTGNDFIMIDNRTEIFPKENVEVISNLCNRHFGIGADGVILIENDTKQDFKMIYFNADGSQTFCGNGGRCAVAFARYLNIIKNKTNFNAVDGPHFAEIKNKIVSLKMIDVDDIRVQENSVFVYTGTQHHVEMVDSLNDYPVYEKGKKKTTSNIISLPVEGGALEVSFTEENGHYKDVYLQGSATFVFKGKIQI